MQYQKIHLNIVKKGIEKHIHMEYNIISTRARRVLILDREVKTHGKAKTRYTRSDFWSVPDW